MVQEYKSVAIIGGGASGCVCAYFLDKAGIDVTVFEKTYPLKTLLPTGGGRCNLAHGEYDIRDLAKNYPRGEKFLLSVFSQFSTYDTLAFFEEIGIETYEQPNGRIFPKSDSSKEVREKILEKLKNVNFVKKEVIDIIPISNGYKIKTDNEEYFFSDVVISIGGHSGFKFKNLKHRIIDFKPSLVGLNCEEKMPSGITLKDVYSYDTKQKGDMLTTHFGLSGPLIYTISSIKALDSFPYNLTFNLINESFDFQELLNKNPHKEIKNILSDYLPESFVKYLLGDLAHTKAHQINGKIRDEILDKIHNYKVIVTGTNIGSETVSAGGVELNEINSKTMESKLHPNLYFTGECLNIDGFCGGFNLQNAWSTAYVAANGIIKKLSQSKNPKNMLI